MITYQYAIVETDRDDSVLIEEDVLSSMGKEGWELVTIMNVKNQRRFYFKGVVPEAPEG